MNGSNASRATCCSTLFASTCAKSGFSDCGSAAIAKRTVESAAAPPAAPSGAVRAQPAQAKTSASKTRRRYGGRASRIARPSRARAGRPCSGDLGFGRGVRRAPRMTARVLDRTVERAFLVVAARARHPSVALAAFGAVAVQSMTTHAEDEIFHSRFRPRFQPRRSVRCAPAEWHERSRRTDLRSALLGARTRSASRRAGAVRSRAHRPRSRSAPRAGPASDTPRLRRPRSSPCSETRYTYAHRFARHRTTIVSREFHGVSTVAYDFDSLCAVSRVNTVALFRRQRIV